MLKAFKLNFEQGFVRQGIPSNRSQTKSRILSQKNSSIHYPELYISAKS